MEKPDIFGDGNANYVSFDEIEDAFRTPTQRQDYYEQQPDADPAAGGLGRLADPDGSASDDFGQPDGQPVDHEHAMRTGERIARLIDTGIDFTLSNFVARNGESYRADERDLQDIAEAWGEISEERQWSLGPEWTLAILYVMVYGPLVKQALYDRRMAALEARQQLLEERMRQFEKKDDDSHDGNEPKHIRIDPAAAPPEED